MSECERSADECEVCIRVPASVRGELESDCERSADECERSA
jgi:hypothetical protein